MGYRNNISRDVKLAAIRLYQRRLLPLVRLILDCLVGISKLWRSTGDVVVRHTFGIRGPRVFSHRDVEYLWRIVEHRSDRFLDKLEEQLRTNRFISASFSTILRALRRAGFSYTKLRKVAAERNETLCSDFIQRMAQYLPEQLGFFDEMSKDERTSIRSRGRSAKGT